MQSDPVLWLLVLLSGALLLSAAFQWLKLAKHRERVDQAPAIPIASFRYAAGITGLGFATLGAALLWVALVKL